MSSAGPRVGPYELTALLGADDMKGTRVAAWSLDGRLSTR